MAAITNALVIGLGASGDAAARLLVEQGARVTVADVGASPVLEARSRLLQGEGMAVQTGCRALPSGDFDLCVISPGVPLTDEWVTAMRRRGIRVISELELGWSFRASRVLAVTGSNGKSTLVKLCREALEAAGLHAVAGGNYGIPLSEWVRRRPAPDWIVTEVSSFQLEAVDHFAPDVGILLNINPNHLDRHGTMAVYEEMKARLFRHMGPRQSAVLPTDVSAAVRAAVPGTCVSRTFGLGPDADYRYAGGQILSRWLTEPVSVADTFLDNEIMGLTASACAAAMDGCGVSPQCVTAAAREFRGLPHRMEKVASLNGVTFVNDSKATNLAAMAAGLRMTPGTVRLIAGGRLKEKDLAPVKKVLVNRVKRVYLIGEYSQVMAAAWQGDVSCVVCADLREAVQRAWNESGSGETILLSPGCASFDQFKSFEDRGEQFSEIVRQIERGELA